MCIHAYQLDEEPLTRAERLTDMAEVRAHHRRLADEANQGLAGAVARFREHLQQHHLDAARRRAARTK